MTPAETKRIEVIEETLDSLNKIIVNASSKNQLNRLLTLLKEEVKKVENLVTNQEEKITELLDLARKLQ
jgi:hypothetical protein